MKPSISLQMIVKDEVDQVAGIIVQAAAYLDRANITATTKPAYERLKKLFADTPDVQISYFEWIDDFAAARNYNLELCDTDYFFWIDADDSFDFKAVPDLLRLAVDNSYEVIYLPYDYAQDKDGRTVTLHWRERLIKNNAGFEWRGVVHENLLRDTTFSAKRLDSPTVIHHAGDPKASQLRNHEILLNAVKGKDLDDIDPRDLHYLGISYFGLHQFEQAIATLEDYIKVGGWDEEIYRSFIKISECHYMLDHYPAAMENALKAAAIMPHYQEAYFTLARYEYANEHWAECLEWIEVAMSKPTPKSMSIQNPQVVELAKLQAADCMFQMRMYAKAYKYLQQVPDYLRGDYEEIFKSEANLERFVEIVPQILQQGYIQPDKFYHSLENDIKYDPRLKWLRYQVVKPTVWPEKSVVIFCGAGYEEWSAGTLGKGMGGSEEAVVYLARELTRQGYAVDVYGEVPEKYSDDFPNADHTVVYHPWREFDPRDTFDTLVAWRSPDFADRLNARVKIIDLHDVLPPEALKRRPDVTYFVKSQFQRKLYPDLPDEQFAVIGNGIVKAQFEGKATKRPHSVGYFSSYYRGLEALIDMWPAIRKEVPDAELYVAYGWGSYTAFQGEDNFYKRMEAKLAKIGAVYEGGKPSKNYQGVIMHNRLSHETLASLMKQTQVWAYPTQFPETYCITALKAQEACMYPVTTTAGALPEVTRSGELFDTRIMYTDGYQQQKFVKSVVAALKEGKLGKPVPGCDWSDVATKWIEHIEKGRHAKKD